MAIFQRKHYQAVAEVLQACKDNSEDITSDEWDLIKSFAALFSSDNPNFNQEKFLKACEMEKE